MQWDNFQTHGESPERAFEALAGLLFERALTSERSSKSAAQVVFVNGAGGDGGVEAYAELDDGTVTALQAKWFRSSLQNAQLEQIRASIRVALEVRPKIARYIVALPRKLGNARRAGGKTSERDRWARLISEFSSIAPQVTIELWDEPRLEKLLIEYSTDGFSRYWFARSTLSTNDLLTRFKPRNWPFRTCCNGRGYR
jgi:hypothetical protein